MLLVSTCTDRLLISNVSSPFSLCFFLLWPNCTALSAVWAALCHFGFVMFKLICSSGHATKATKLKSKVGELFQPLLILHAVASVPSHIGLTCPEDPVSFHPTSQLKLKMLIYVYLYAFLLVYLMETDCTHYCQWVNGFIWNNDRSNSSDIVYVWDAPIYLHHIGIRLMLA